MKKSQLFSISSALIFLVFSIPLHAQVPGNGLVFDGNNEYVVVQADESDELNPEYFLTMECWVNLNEAASVSHRPHLVTKFQSYAIAVDTNEFATVFINTGEWWEVQSTTLIDPQKWYHLAGTYDGVNLRIFVNGIEENAIVIDDTLNQNMENIRIGALNPTPNNTNTNGSIEEVRIWDVTRTQAQIQNSMNRTIPGSTPGLVGYWRFDESSGTNADCETPYDNDGTLQNMSSADWITSTAPLGETSIFDVSSDITETSGTAVDVDFRASPEGPGSGRSLAVMQVNELPNSVSGLHPDRANQYWEIWSEDPDFDGNFTADVRFHYDAISGLPTESSIELFRRDDATGTWSPATGYTVITNDGGSSSGTDGIGFVEVTITESTTGDFSGQYILSWTNEPPVVSDIPDQTVAEGTAFTTINLDDYMADPDHADSDISWTATGETDVTVTITDRVATITADDPEWNGSNVITFTAEDPEGETDSDDVTFEVTAVNDPPVVGDIPDQEIAEGASFGTIMLDDFVTDIDNDITAMTWTASGQSDLSVDITDRVATITMSSPDWNGSETITFQAEDPDGETGSDQTTFTVTPVNDAPVVSDIPTQTVAEGTPFATINLDDYVTDVDNAVNQITWTVSRENDVTVTITDRVATITPDDPEWNGSDVITFTATDPGGLEDFDNIICTVTFINDLPVVSDIPDQIMAEGQNFSQINLDDFVADVDDADSLISWTVQGDKNVTVNIENRVATIIVDNAEWNGSDTLIFTAIDTSGASDTDTSIFTVTGVNDAPTLEKAIPDTAAVAEIAFTFVLDPNTFADVDTGDVLVLSAGTPAWLTFNPANGTFSGTPADGDKGLVEVIVTATDDSLASVADTFNIVVTSYVGIINPLDGLEINLYPNPNNGRFVIESDMFELKDVILEIFNENGQLIWNRKIRDEIGTLHESVDLNNPASGLYILRVRTKSGMINKRFVIGY